MLVTCSPAAEFKWSARPGGHSCLPRSGSRPPKALCAVAKPSAKPTTRRMANAAASLSAKIPRPPWRLIANLELELELTYRKLSLLRISNRKKTTVLRAPWRLADSLPSLFPSCRGTACRARQTTLARPSHRHGFSGTGTPACAPLPKPRAQRLANAVASLSSEIRTVNRDAISNRDAAIRISRNPYHCSEFEISNRDKMRVFRMALFSLAKSRLSQVQPSSESCPQIDHAAPRAYTGPSAEGDSSWKIPSY